MMTEQGKPIPTPPPNPVIQPDFPTWLLTALQKQKPSTTMTVDLLAKLVTDYKKQAK